MAPVCWVSHLSKDSGSPPPATSECTASHRCCRLPPPQDFRRAPGRCSSKVLPDPSSNVWPQSTTAELSRTQRWQSPFRRLCSVSILLFRRVVQVFSQPHLFEVQSRSDFPSSTTLKHPLKMASYHSTPLIVLAPKTPHGPDLQMEYK